METEKWSDGSDMICAQCGNPIRKGQAFQSTISQDPKKRNAYHFPSTGGMIALIGSPKRGTTEFIQWKNGGE